MPRSRSTARRRSPAPRTARPSPRSGGPRTAPTAEALMRLALAEAERGLGRTHPNPPVGAVVVKDGRVVGRGFHSRAGEPHAEVMALRRAGSRAKGADLYVTLEPCNHTGRTPPCTEAILAAGIRRVWVGSRDPNPRSGRGLRRLRAAGVEVVPGVLRTSCDDLVRCFARHVTTGRPWVVLKGAITLDGRIATAGGDSRWVTGEAARRQAHVLRDELDAVLVGAGTVAADDPLLTTRLEKPATKGRPPRTPLRVVLDGSLSVVPEARLFDVSAGPVLVFTAVDSGARVEALRARGVEVECLPAREGRIELARVLEALGKRGLTSLLVEGGSEVTADFLRGELADELQLFIAPKILGGDGVPWAGALGTATMADVLQVKWTHVTRLGEDLLLSARLGRGAGVPPRWTGE